MLRFPPWKVNHGMGSLWNKDSGLRPCSCPGSMVACHPALTLDALTPQLLPLYFFFFFLSRFAFFWLQIWTCTVVWCMLFQTRHPVIDPSLPS